MEKVKITGIILAGGKNSRMGRDKAFLEINGVKIIEGILSLFERIFEEIIIVTNTPINYLYYDLATLVTDVLPGIGAIGGVYTGLFYATYEQAFICACDMPFLDRDFIRYMLKQAPNYDIVMPKSHDGFQPLHAIYSKKCLSTIEKNIRERQIKIITLLNRRHKTLIIGEDIINSYPHADIMFLNINTPEDLKQVQEIALKKEKWPELMIS